MKDIDVGQLLQLEEDKRKGFNTKWLVDKQGCPACGNHTKYELKKPHLPQVSACEHVRNLTEQHEGIYVVRYHYQIEKKSKRSPTTMKDHSQRRIGQTTLEDFGKIEVNA